MAKLTLKEMKTRFTQMVGLDPSVADLMWADLVWALAKDPELRAELDRRVDDAMWIFQAPPVSKCQKCGWTHY